MNTTDDIVLNISEAAALAKTSRTSLYLALRSGSLRAKKHGARTVILYDDLKAWGGEPTALQTHLCGDRINDIKRKAPARWNATGAEFASHPLSPEGMPHDSTETESGAQGRVSPVLLVSNARGPSCAAVARRAPPHHAPRADTTVGGAGGEGSRHRRRRPMTVLLDVEVLDDTASPRRLQLRGRDAWALRELVRAGATGCTPIESPGPRWSGYVFKQRRQGLVIKTIHESHGGAFAGHHARYRLLSRVRVHDHGDAGA